MRTSRVTNVVFAGLGGQGVIRASSILAEVVFALGLDVKKAEVHGMSQRGGFVTSDVRFGARVLSPMVPAGEADYVVLLEPACEAPCMPLLRPSGIVIGPASIGPQALVDKRSMNIALLGALSGHLDGVGDTALDAWEAAIRRNFRPALQERNWQSFIAGRSAWLRTARRAADDRGGPMLPLPPQPGEVLGNAE